MTPDEVCAKYADRNVKITSRVIDDSVLLEGDGEALEFLGNLLLAQANDRRSCKKSIEPNGAGSALFTETSNLGIYIHRLPCDHGEIEGSSSNDGEHNKRLQPTPR
jgi:hypothetical protein